MAETINILDGSTFLGSKPNGDIEAGPTEPEGLFFKDMRQLAPCNIGGASHPFNCW